MENAKVCTTFDAHSYILIFESSMKTSAGIPHATISMAGRNELLIFYDLERVVLT